MESIETARRVIALSAVTTRWILVTARGAAAMTSRRGEHSPRQASRVLPVLDHEPPVDQDVLDPRRIAMRIVVRREIADALRIEDRQVRFRARADHAAIPQAQPTRRHPGH